MCRRWDTPIILPEEPMHTPAPRQIPVLGPFPRALVPVMSVPMKLPCTRFPVLLESGKPMSISATRLFEIILPAPGVVPPMVLLEELFMTEIHNHYLTQESQ